MNLSAKQNLTTYPQMEIRTPKFIAQTKSALEKTSYKYLTWSYEHPLANALLKTAGGLALVGALQVMPSPNEIAAGFRNMSQGVGNLLDNLGPQPVNAASLIDATEPPPCTIPSEITISPNSSISAELWPSFEASGLTTDEAKLRALDVVLEHIDPSGTRDLDIVHTGDTFSIPNQQLCEMAGSQLKQGNMAMSEAMITTPLPEVCSLTQPLTVAEGGTFWSTVVDALKANGVSEEQIGEYYTDFIVANPQIENIGDIPAGTTINIPDFEGCDTKNGNGGIGAFITAVFLVGGAVGLIVRNSLQKK